MSTAAQLAHRLRVAMIAAADARDAGDLAAEREWLTEAEQVITEADAAGLTADVTAAMRGAA